MKKFMRVFTVLIMVLSGLFITQQAASASSFVVVGFAYQDTYLRGARQNIVIYGYQGPCDSSGYLTHDSTEPPYADYRTGISSVILGGPYNCNGITAYTGQYGTRDFHACWSGASPGYDFDRTPCNNNITAIRVFHIG